MTEADAYDFLLTQSEIQSCVQSVNDEVKEEARQAKRELHPPSLSLPLPPSLPPSLSLLLFFLSLPPSPLSLLLYSFIHFHINWFSFYQRPSVFY